MFKPDRYLVSVWYAEKFHGEKSADIVRRWRTKKLKSDATKIKKRLIKQKGACEICGFSFEPVLQIHHILPLSQGGDNSSGNIICVCPNCHKTLHYAYSCRNKDDTEEFVSILISPMYRDGNTIDKIYDISFSYLSMKYEVQRCKEEYEFTIPKPGH